MMGTKSSKAASGRQRRLARLVAPALASLCIAMAPAAAFADDDDITRDLSIEQTSMYTVQAPAPVADTGGEGLNVVAWVDQDDNTYAVGEKVRLFVKSNKDAYLTVLNVGPSGNTTLLYPNAYQEDTRIGANQTVEIPAADSGASIRVSGPSVGRELIKVIASTDPQPLFEAGDMTAAGPFAMLGASAQSVAKDLQVTMSAPAAQEYEWDDYNKVITTTQ